MSGSLRTEAHTPRPSWRHIIHGAEHVVGGIHQGSNGGAPDTSFGEVLAGTIVGRLSTGQIRPAGASELVSTLTTANVVDVDDASNFFAGDVISLVDDTGADIVASRNVTVVDKVSTPNTVTFDGATASAAIGDVIRLTGVEAIPVGILETQINTIEIVGTTPTAVTRKITYALHGHVRESQLAGFSETMRRYLAPGVFDGTLNEVVATHLGFSIRDV